MDKRFGGIICTAFRAMVDMASAMNGDAWCSPALVIKSCVCMFDLCVKVAAVFKGSVEASMYTIVVRHAHSVVSCPSRCYSARIVRATFVKGVTFHCLGVLDMQITVCGIVAV